MPQSLESLTQTLAQHHQSHLLHFWSHLDSQQREQLIGQLDAIDWSLITRLVKHQTAMTDWHQLARRAEPPPAIRLNDPDIQRRREQAWHTGQQALREGKVGFILVAGGQGTRLGFDQPKGIYPIGPVSGRTLFQMHCDRLLGIGRRSGRQIPVYVMTSPATDLPTREYFEQHNRCGLDPAQLSIFCQGMMPAVDSATGKLLLSSKHSLALSPDGHGGLVVALHKSGLLERAAEQGIDYFYYAQIDNPLAQVCQPDLIGFHLLARSQMTTQVVQKRFAEEKVGNVVSIDGRVQIIEYSDLPNDVAVQANPDGTLRFWAGNIAIHVFDRQFLQSVVDSADGLPFHVAHKPVSHIDVTTEKNIEPKTANAIKFERFVFDLLPMAQRAIVVEGAAEDVFAPVKNANGAPMDTPAHCQQAILNQHRRWLEASGCSMEHGVAVEISPQWAENADEVKARLSEPVRFSVDTYLC